MAGKAVAKKAASKKVVKKAAPKKAAPKKPATKKAAPKKAAPKKVVKKAAPKKAAPKKVVKKSAPKKAAPKKAVVKKAAPKKAAPKKVVPAKKAAPKKAAAKPAPKVTPKKDVKPTPKPTPKPAPAPAPEVPVVPEVKPIIPIAVPAPRPASTTTKPRKGARKTIAAAQRPAPAVREDETPWTAAELKGVRKDLLDELARLEEELQTAEEGLADLIRDSGDGAGDDQADAGSKTFEREHEMSLANNARDMIDQVKHALGRLDDGTYGKCESCGNPVGKFRLQAFPRATLCMVCKQAEERLSGAI